MKIFSDWPIQLQLMFGIGSSVAVIFLLAISYNYSTLRKQIISESHLEINDAVITGVQDLISILDGIKKSTDMLANVTRFSNKPEEELQDLLRNTISTNKNIYGGAIAIDPGRSSSKRGYSPYYFRPSNGVVEYSNLADKNYQYADQQWFSGAQQRGRPFWSDPYYDDGGGNILMATYSVPVERDDRFYAVITSDISLDLIQESLQSIKFGETGHIILLDVNLNVISAPRTAEIMTPFFDTISNPDHLKEWQHLLTNFQQRSGDILHLPCPHTEDRCIIVASSMALTNWPMLVIYPEKEMFSELRYFTVKFGPISLGA